MLIERVAIGLLATFLAGILLVLSRQAMKPRCQKRQRLKRLAARLARLGSLAGDPTAPTG
jgi:hypothetical protein